MKPKRKSNKHLRMPNIKAKANANFICQHCGSTEMIQAHHQTPGDDSTLIALCAVCHHKQHPDMALGLFTNKMMRPYWENKSMGSLAKEVGVCARTIARRAQRNDIPAGTLKPLDELLLKQPHNYSTEPVAPICCEQEVSLSNSKYHCSVCGKVITLFCPSCGYTWDSKVKQPKACPRCKIYLWKRNK
jgi:hypothetical protein